MATTTPNYGWAVPTSTDLVKDGATAIETLGDSIDASMFTALGTKKAGMVLLNTSTFSAVSGVTFTDKFTNDYTNYFCTINITASTTAAYSVRLRNGTTDQTGGNYTRQILSASSTTVSGSVSTAETAFNFGNATTDTQSVSFYIFQPKSNNPTMFQSSRTSSNSSSPIISIIYGNYSANYEATGLNFTIASGTMTGEISLYGLAK